MRMQVFLATFLQFYINTIFKLFEIFCVYLHYVYTWFKDCPVIEDLASILATLAQYPFNCSFNKKRCPISDVNTVFVLNGKDYRVFNLYTYKKKREQKCFYNS